MSWDQQKATQKPLRSVILASSSPRRRELLGQLLEHFEVINPQVSELDEHADGPEQLVSENARIKANTVADGFLEHWIIGADTVVALAGDVFGKPQDLTEARAMLKKMSKKTHQVHTGICLINRSLNLHRQAVFTSQVTFLELNDSTINNYFSHVDPLDKAGGYAIQTRSDMIIESFDGSKNNVIGLPTEGLIKWFKELGIV